MGRYVDVALGMVRLGDLVVPHLHHEMPHVTKPPMTCWAMARRLVPDRPELQPVVCATMLLPFVAANVTTTDTLLAFWETAAAAAFVTGWWAGGPERRRWCRSPACSRLPASRGVAASETWVPGGEVAGFLLVGPSWYVVVITREPSLLGELVGGEIVPRLTSAPVGRRAQWYGALKVYLPTLVGGLLP